MIKVIILHPSVDDIFENNSIHVRLKALTNGGLPVFFRSINHLKLYKKQFEDKYQDIYAFCKQTDFGTMQIFTDDELKELPVFHVFNENQLFISNNVNDSAKKNEYYVPNEGIYNCVVAGKEKEVMKMKYSTYVKKINVYDIFDDEIDEIKRKFTVSKGKELAKHIRFKRFINEIMLYGDDTKYSSLFDDITNYIIDN